MVNSILDLVGNTPIISLRRIAEGVSPPLLAKLESANPTGSVKDRVALAMVKDAEERRLLRKGYTIVEATSGNMGLALAMVVAVRGYHLKVFMPESAPLGSRKLLLRYGVEVHLTPAAQGMDGAQKAARDATESNSKHVSLDMFRNPVVVQAHRETTGKEILDATGGEVSAFVAGVGTAGTITGVGERLKEHDPSIRIVAVEPAGSQVLGRGVAGHHSIPGIGANFVPPLLNRDIIDQVVAVTDAEASRMTLRLAQEEGLLVGLSSGANVEAALRVAQGLGPGKAVVTILPDRGERYTDLPV